MSYRFSVEGNRAMAESDVLFNQGKVGESIVFAFRAASLYGPGLAHVRRADARLDAIAGGAEAARMSQAAMTAWQAIRATELLRPEGWGRSNARLELANRRLAGLLVAGSDETALGNDERHSRLVLAQLKANAGPSHVLLLGQTAALSVLVIGLLWMAGAVRQPLGKWSRQALLACATVVVGASCWAICLLLA